MAYRRRFRRNRGVWFPTELNTAITSSATIATGAVAGNVVLNTSPVIANSFDVPADVTVLGAGQLGNALGQGYMVKRVVGKVFAESSEAAAGGDGGLFFAGLFVDRTNQDGTLSNIAAWNPFDSQSSQKRWLWRRVWRLWGSGAFGVPTAFSTNYGASGGSVLDGPHLDCKMKARVTWQERLFFAVAIQSITNGVKNGIFRWNLRLFANPIKADNR